MGTSYATRATRFFSAASRLASRAGEPSPTRMTPGLPTARCTTSMFRLAAMAGVTVQLPRMFSSTAAAAPGWPSMAEYWADLREPAEQDHRDQQAEQHAQRDQQQQPGR